MTTTALPRTATPVPAASDRARQLLKRLVRGHEADPRWARPALLGVLAITALLYLWDLGRNGYANDFYAAAVQAGTKSWKAFFFGSFDSSNAITVDKTPASLWVMELSGRLFGFSSWSMLVPQALEGVASVALLYAAVRRWFGPQAGLIAGAVLALTPVSALMFRFNNPDSLLVLLMTGAGFAVAIAIENGKTRWLVLCGVLLGFAFLAKMMQAFLVLPGFAIAYLWAGAPRLRTRIWQLLAGLGGVIAGAGWWIVIAELVPAADRPYFGGSTNNNILQLAFGYNGLGRLSGSETGSVGGGGGGGSMWGGPASYLRLFRSEFGGQVSWLLPAALISLVALLWVSRRAARTSRIRAFALIWGGWLIVTGLTFSYMQGIIHPYYMVALAPAIGALVGVGGAALWQQGLGWAGRACVATAVGVSGVWAYVLLNRTPTWLPWLRWVVVIAGILGAAWILLAPLAGDRLRRGRVLTIAPLTFALVAGLGGPVAYTLDTVNSSYTGSIPSAGPASTSSFGGGGGAPGGTGGGFTPGGTRTGTGGTGTGGPGGGGVPGGAPGGTNGSAGTGTGGSRPAGAPTGTGGAGRTGRTGGFGGGTAGGAGGLSGDTSVSSALEKLLEKDASKYTWVAATEGSQEAAPLELATGDAVIAIGGFNGTDPSPTLAEFKALVAKGEIHYYIGRNSSSFGGGTSSSSIATWVAAHYKSETVGGTTVYDLTQAN
jgi:4-amino-4-deoxy-L-arabinose transferase-like glycosyltransferase